MAEEKNVMITKEDTLVKVTNVVTIKHLKTAMLKRENYLHGEPNSPTW